MNEHSAIFASMLDPLVILGAIRDDSGRIVDFRYLDANPAACSYNAVSRDQLVGMTVLQLLPHHAATSLISDYAQVVETETPLVLDDYAYPREVFGGQERFYDIRAIKLGDGLSYTWRDVTERRTAAEALRLSEMQLQAALDSELDPHLFLTPIMNEAGDIADFKVSRANTAAATYFGLSDAALQGRVLSDLADPAEFPHLLSLYGHVVQQHATVVRDAMRAISGLTARPARFDLRAIPADGGLSVTWRDVTDRVEAAEATARSEELYRLLAENSADVVVHVRDGRIVWASSSVEEITGQPAEASIGVRPEDWIHPDDAHAYQDAITAAALGQVTVTRTRSLTPDGISHWVEALTKAFYDRDGRPDGVITRIRLIDDVVLAEQQALHASQHDALTALLNRGEALQRLAQITGHLPRTGTQTAVLFCDVDDFKSINDTYGHSGGDQALRAIAQRIGECIREEDAAARIGGDEMLVILDGVHDLAQAIAVAEKVRVAVRQPIPMPDGRSATTSLSIGVTLAAQGDGVDRLVARADEAMYEAKASGRDRVVAIG